MKPTLFLPVLAAALWLQPAVSRAQDDQTARRAAAEQLLVSMHTEQMLNSTITRMYDVMGKMTEGLGKQAGRTAEQIAAVKKGQAEAQEAIRTQLSFDSLKGDMVQVYAESFTTAEMKQLNDFYQTPIGQKMIEKQPEISEKMSKVTQQRVMAIMPALMQKIQAAASTAAPAAQ